MLNVQLGQDLEYVHVRLAMSKLEQNVFQVSFVLLTLPSPIQLINYNIKINWR